MGDQNAERGQMHVDEHRYRQTLASNPNDILALANLGLLLADAQKLEEAEVLQRAALALLPNNAKLHSNLANLLAQLGRNEESEQFHRSSLELDCGSAVSWSNFGVFLTTLGHEVEAEACFRRALEQQSDHARARYNLSYLLLRQGRMKEGWGLHEARYAKNLPDPGSVPPDLPYPQWQGEDLTGKSLLIWPEQGLGDEIQFCRYVSLLKMRGASRVTWVCKAPLRRILATLKHVDLVLSVEEAHADAGKHDYWSFPMSLPLHFNTRSGDVPASIPYLHANPDLLSLALAGPLPMGLRVGLVWRGNKNNPNDKDRSLPGLTTLKPLWTIKGASYVSLQKGEGEEEASPPPLGMAILPMGSRISDFADAACLLSQLDLLISVDTAIAHLAGALGKSCWLLLPAHMTDWRWLNAGEASAWYPGTHRLFRQQHRGDWTAVISRVALALAELIQSRSN